ncbi:MarR family winged helix-turn-helix transcriptional regulator [Propylenella binzhouense]|uniref:MarR family transcriptional regulator n=1 Tax=Propylenella binzhouense TaxID=2555902 RepID=A0A964WU86_9HYPH|nr:MarR family transcriptional regulator [Propylenella binzhouense]MYZ48783.1 MarR family transcriptional regulator [Propylenella binzhouense]
MGSLPPVPFLDELTAVNRKLRTLFDAHAKAHGLTFSRARLFLQLARQDGPTQTELADILEVEQPTMVRLIDGLEAQGLVERRAAEGDRRVKRIFLTDAARSQADEILRFTARLRNHVLHGIPEDELAVATRVLRTVAGNIAVCS